MTIHSLDVLLFLFGTSLFIVPCPVLLLLPNLHIGFSRGSSADLVFPPISEFSTVYCDHTVKDFGRVNKAEINVFLEQSCFFHDTANIGNLISGYSIFSNTSLNIRKFTVHILLKPGFENFKPHFTSV